MVSRGNIYIGGGKMQGQKAISSKMRSVANSNGILEWNF